MYFPRVSGGFIHRLTGPLLFSEVFFQSRRWSWCRNPILPPTTASANPKFYKISIPGLRLDFNTGEFFSPFPGIPAGRACHEAETSLPVPLGNDKVVTSTV